MTPRIPNGWRLVRCGTFPKKGYKRWSIVSLGWVTFQKDSDYPVWSMEIIIRRIAKKGRTK